MKFFWDGHPDYFIEVRIKQVFKKSVSMKLSVRLSRHARLSMADFRLVKVCLKIVKQL